MAVDDYEAYASVVADVCDVSIAGIRLEFGSQSQLVASAGEGYDPSVVRAVLAAATVDPATGFFVVDEPIASRNGDRLGVMRMVDGLPYVPSVGRTEALRILASAIADTIAEDAERGGTSYLPSIGRAVEFVPDPIAILEFGEPETLPTIAYVNRAFLDLFGHASTDALGASAEIVCGPETERTRFADLLRADDADEPLEAIVELYDARRSRRVVQMRARPLSSDCRIVSFRDLTDELAAENALSDVNLRLRSLVEGNTDAVFTLDRTGACVAANAAAEALEGFSSDALFPTRERFPARLLGGESFAFDTTCTDESGRLRNLVVRAIPTRVAGATDGAFLIVTDVTERRALAALAAHQAERAHALSQIAAATESSLPDFIDQVLKLVLTSFGMHGAYVAEVDGDRLAVTNVAGEEVYPMGTSLPVDRTRVREMVERDGVYTADEVGVAGWGAIICALLHVAGNVTGAIGFVSRDTIVFDDCDRDFVRLVATLVSAALERRRQLQELDRLAFVDDLTGLPNRTQLLRDLASAVDALQPFAVHIVDLDDFKSINDLADHAVGNRVLREVAMRIRNACRPADSIARLGGDAFAVLQMDGRERSAAVALATRVLDDLRVPFQIDDCTIGLGASIGTARFPSDGTDPDLLLRRADTAMYRAKTNGKSRIETWREALDSDR